MFWPVPCFGCWVQLGHPAWAVGVFRGGRACEGLAAGVETYPDPAPPGPGARGDALGRAPPGSRLSARARSLRGCPEGRRRGTGAPWTAGPYSYTRETGPGRTVVWPKREPPMGGIVLGGLERVARAAVSTGPDKNSPPFLRRKDWPLRQPTKTARPQTKFRPGSVVVR